MHDDLLHERVGTFLCSSREGLPALLGSHAFLFLFLPSIVWNYAFSSFFPLLFHPLLFLPFISSHHINPY